MRINPVSFTGTYRTYHTNPKDFSSFEEVRRNTNYAGGQVTPVRVIPDSRGYYPKYKGQDVYLIGVANCPILIADQLFIGTCKKKNVTYIEEGDKSLMEPNGVVDRIIKPQSARNIAFLAEIDVDKFEEFARKQKKSNLAEVAKQYEDKDTQRVTDDFILSGFDIPAPVLHLTPTAKQDAALMSEAIKHNGGKPLKNDNIEVKFDTVTDGPDQCLYYAIKKCGAKKFPVCVMPDTYKLGEALGFLTEYKKPRPTLKKQKTKLVS